LVAMQSRTRGRRRVISDDEEDVIAQKKPARRASSQQKTPTPTPSPQKKRSKTKGKAAATTKPAGKNIYSFFNAATHKQQENPRLAHPVVHDVSIAEDDILDEDPNVKTGIPLKKPAIPAGIKRNYAATQDANDLTLDQSTSSMARKFLKSSSAGKVPAPQTIVAGLEPKPEDLRPWTEKYGPSDIGDVVVHKKKIADIRSWLDAALAGQPYRKMLVLKGPAGSGKTTALHCLAAVLRISINEWRNPATSDFTSQDYQSISRQFDEFVNRGRIFGGLDIAGPDGEVIDLAKPRDDMQDDEQVVIVEEFPHTLLRSTAALQSFRSTLLQSCAVASTAPRKTRPVVLIVSESATMGNAGPTDTLTAHRLLGSDILHHPSVTIIELNPVAPTFIAKALQQILQKHQRATGLSSSLNQDVLAKISEIGDLRNATSTLEYLSLGNGQKTESASSTLKTKSRSTKKSKPAKSSEQDPQTQAALSYITLRESTLGLFHATGKVLYNKRAATTTSERGVVELASRLPEDLPLHMNNLARNMASEVDIPALMDEAGTDVATFLSTLHENYALSCYSPNDSDELTLDAMNGCLDSLCDADIILPAMAARGAASEGIRQEELAFHTAIGGVMLNLPYPVHRRPPPGKGKADAHRMFYPTGLKLWRKKEELMASIDSLVERAVAGTLLAGADLHPSNSRDISQPGRMPDTPATSELGTDTKNIITNIGSGQSARYEMLVERLPYLSQIMAASNNFPPISRQIEQVTRFTGVGIAQNEDEEDILASSRRFTSASESGGIGMAFPRTKGGTEDLNVSGLVLEDDDIEDD
jgi:cell cycle checkpoint protein